MLSTALAYLSKIIIVPSLLSRWAFVLMPSAARWNIGSIDQGCFDPTQTMLPYFVFTRETHGELKLLQNPAALALGSTGLLAFGQPPAIAT